jgi:polyribonucleotide nucleotidyltransferase
MLSTLRQPREDISPIAPRLLTLHINPEKIGLLIGPGGKTIKGIQESTGAKIDIEDDGTVYVSHHEAAGAESARLKVEALTEEVRVGKIYEGKVTSIKDFGAFVEILPGRDGLVHISELDDKYVGRVEDVCKVGDRLQVKVIAIDEHDRVKLSRKVLLREQTKPGEGGPRPERPAGAEGGEPREPRERREPREPREPRSEGRGEPREPREGRSEGRGEGRGERRRSGDGSGSGRRQGGERSSRSEDRSERPRSEERAPVEPPSDEEAP